MKRELDSGRKKILEEADKYCLKKKKKQKQILKDIYSNV